MNSNIYEEKSILIEYISDGWGYEIVGYEECVELKYFEYDKKGKKKIKHITSLMSGEFADRVAKAILELNHHQ